MPETEFKMTGRVIQDTEFKAEVAGPKTRIFQCLTDSCRGMIYFQPSDITKACAYCGVEYARTCDCDADQKSLCPECPGAADIRELFAREDLSEVRNIARLALACKELMDIALLAEQIARVATALESHANTVQHRAILQYLAHLLKNRVCPNPEFTFRRAGLMVETLAELGEKML